MSRLSPVPRPRVSSASAWKGMWRVIAACALAQVLVVWALVALNRAPAQSRPVKTASVRAILIPREDPKVQPLNIPMPAPPIPLNIELKPTPPTRQAPPTPRSPRLTLQPIALELPAIELKTASAIMIPTRQKRQVIQTTQTFAAPTPQAPEPAAVPKPITAAVSAAPETMPIIEKAPRPQPTGPLSAGDVDQPPQETFVPSPIYPELLRRRGAEGSVSVRLLIDRQGLVKTLSVTASTGSRRFVDAVEKAAKKWRFSPPLHNGQPVEVWAEKTLRFTLRP